MTLGKLKFSIDAMWDIFKLSHPCDYSSVRKQPKSVHFYCCHVKKALLAVAAISGNKPPGGDVGMNWIKNGRIQLNIEIWGTSAGMWLENYAI